MTYCDFQTVTYGKWVLAGEHAVLRGHEALVFPIPQYTLFLRYHATNKPAKTHYTGPSGPTLGPLFWSVLEYGFSTLEQPLAALTGEFFLESNIPLGMGLGASAALCVAIARWFKVQGLLKEISVYTFAKTLEDLFHGQSSGVDIAGVSALGGVYFVQNQLTPFRPAWQPHWFLSSCKQLGYTSDCTSQVAQIWQKDALQAQQIDATMSQSVHKAKSALTQYTAESLSLLQEAIQQAADCFKQWGLISETLGQHMQTLLNRGALATKPTGSGKGGYVISLWASPPKEMLDLIPISQ